MTIIAYDRPVKDLVAQLSVTEHVTHTAYKKTSVTLHHNAGRLSHEGVLKVWQTRPASAQFDADAVGAIAQYVNVNEYAWACGNTEGNQKSIHIEMANSTLAPDWDVSDVTWNSAARLAGWLFAKIIGERPSPTNFFVHKHWYATACAGPCIDKNFAKILFEAQQWYDLFNIKKPAPLAKPIVLAKKSSTQIAAEVWAGKWGSGPDRAHRLTSAGYNAKAIQDLVNRGVGKTGFVSTPLKKSVVVIADEVIAGKWGNGPDRITRLTRAGYSFAAVQAEVNRHF